MKKISIIPVFICALTGSRMYAQTESVRRDYLPGIKRSVSSKMNLVSVVKTDTDPLKIRCTSVNTIAEQELGAKKDVWLQTVNEIGNVFSSTRYGKSSTTAAFNGRGRLLYAVTRMDMMREPYTYNSASVLVTVTNCE